jgi:trk system potassium uptake protein TrkH
MVLNIKVILSLLSNVIIFLALCGFIPAAYSFISITKGGAEFLAWSTCLIIIGITTKYFTRNAQYERITVKDMFLFTSLVWITIMLFAAIPMYYITELNYISACYESSSAITTTGSSVLANIDTTPRSVILWRSLLQYVGGIGFIAIGIAILPNLNVGGMKLFQTENSTQNYSNVTQKSKSLAKGILLLYFVLTIIAIVTYQLLGMNTFDAFNYALTSISTGGMGTTNSSLNFFNGSIHWAIAIFMFISSLPYAVMFVSLKNLNIKNIFKDQQVKGFTYLIFFVSLLVILNLYLKENYSISDSIRVGTFNVINILSSSGFSLDDYTTKNDFLTLLFLIILPIGGCSGSTSGGLKFFRLQILYTLTKRQTKQLMHPYAIFPQRYNGQTVNDTIIRSIITFFLVYLILSGISALLLTLSGISLMDAISLTISCVSNIGPAIGETFGPNGNFSVLTSYQKSILIVDMLLGRLEVLTMLICFFPSFWKI